MKPDRTDAAPLPLVSVCIPVYNGERFIAAAIESVLGQTLADFELVVIDNASTDRTLGEVGRFSDSRIRLLRNPANIGAAANWNRCLDEARGKYIKLLPADDLLYPTILEKQSRVWEDEGNGDVSLVCAWKDVLDESGRVLYRGRGLRPRGRGEKVSNAEALRRIARSGGNPVGEPHAVLFRAADAAKIGGFDPSAGYVIDLDYWCRLLRAGNLYCVPESLSAFRVNAGSWSASVARSQAAETRRFCRGLLRQGLVTAADARVGSVMAAMTGLLRRALYVALRASKRPAP